jgi:aquaporin Z
MKMHTYVSEAVGTFFLAFVVLLSTNGSFTAVPTAVLAALTLGVCVYTLGSISGTHINPAVTIGAWSIGKISSTNAMYYIVSQFVGGAVAWLVAQKVFAVVSVAPAVISSFSSNVVLAEAVGALIFTFGIAAAVYGRAEKSVSGLVVGVSLLLGISLSVGLGAGGILNPAVALALSSFNLSYLLGPIVGGILGFNLYKFIAEEK